MNKKGEITIALAILVVGFVIGIIEVVKDVRNPTTHTPITTSK